MRYLVSVGLLFISGFTCLMPLTAGAAEGITPKQIVIGQTLTLQGGKNEYGTAVLAGVQTAIDEVNSLGGVAGRTLVLKVMDDDNKSDLAEANARKLVTQDGVFLLFGSIEGGPSTAVMKAANDLKVPFFGPMAGSPTLRTPHQPLVFPVRAEHKEEFRALMAYAHSLGMRRVGFVRSDSETGQLHLDNVQRLAKEVGIEAVTDLSFKSDVSDTGLAAMAQQITSANVQMVFNHGGIGMYESLIRQVRKTGGNAAFYGVNSGSSQLAARLGNLAQGMIFAQVMPSPWERKTAVTRTFQSKFGSGQANKPLSYGSLEGYLTARALIEALKRAGANPTRKSFVDGLRNADLSVEDMKIKYRDNAHVGMSLINLAIVTREGTFRH